MLGPYRTSAPKPPPAPREYKRVVIGPGRDSEPPRESLNPLHVALILSGFFLGLAFEWAFILR